MLSISITCGFLIDSLEKCCQHIAMVLDTGFEDSEWTELDHLLGYYKMEEIYNQVFSYNQKTLRHNIFVEGNGILPPKMIPVFLKMYQVINMPQILSSLCINQYHYHFSCIMPKHTYFCSNMKLLLGQDGT